jgi:hypothetical protein
LASKEQKVKELLERLKHLNAKQADIEKRMKNVEKALSGKEQEG